MPALIPAIPWILGGLALLWTGKEAVDATGEAAEKSASLVKWVVIGGVVYVGYRAAKSGGVLK